MFAAVAHCEEEQAADDSSSSYVPPFNPFKDMSGRVMEIVMSVFGIVVGIAFAVFGYRLFTIDVIFCGFIFLYFLCYLNILAHSDMKWFYCFIISFVPGIVGAAVAFFGPWFGYLFIGADAGFLGGCVVLMLDDGGMIKPVWLQIVFFILVCWAMGYLTLKFQKHMICASMAIIGTWIFIASIDTFCHGQYSKVPYHLVARESLVSVNYATFVEVGMTIVGTVVGMGFQYCLTNKKFDHQGKLRYENEVAFDQV
eukprot:TRINITY_DN2198_c0_g1_i1.p1 TRINITY_DN2198_c0_g1~~TRINITY_DN2198_c0_g1_i1.p1  ORF type:complete len:287 (-),score=49.49 TRINITY_DN2198_c0_g1_i1:94-855(-)